MLSVSDNLLKNPPKMKNHFPYKGNMGACLFYYVFFKFLGVLKQIEVEAQRLESALFYLLAPDCARHPPPPPRPNWLSGTNPEP